MILRFIDNKLFASFLLVAAFFASSMCLAQSSALIFERADIRIESPMPIADAKEKVPTHAALQYNVEVRNEDALRLEYIHTLNMLTPRTGVLIELNAPSIATLPMMNVYTPVDVLFVADDGTVVQIMPSVILGETAGLIQAQSPIKAFLFLKDGEVAARTIRPRDRIAGRMFIPLPKVQN